MGGRGLDPGRELLVLVYARGGMNQDHKSQIPLRYPGRRQVRGWSQTC